MQIKIGRNTASQRSTFRASMGHRFGKDARKSRGRRMTLTARSEAEQQEIATRSVVQQIAPAPNPVPASNYLNAISDPTLSDVVEAIRLSNRSLAEIELNSGVTAQTLRNWLNGRVRWPRNATLDAVISVLGGSRKITWNRN